MLNVGLTGNVAAGKSTVADLFRGWGGVVISADQIVRELQAPGSRVLEAIEHRFGPPVIAEDGSLDRAKLRAIVFDDENALASLNAIMHPAVQRRRVELTAELADSGVEIVIHEIPLLFEVLNPEDFDIVILVDAPAEMRLHRLMRERGLDEQEARSIIETQMPASEKRSKSDFVIENDGDLERLSERTRLVWENLVAEGRGNR